MALSSRGGQGWEASPGAASPPSLLPAGSGDSPPPETAEKLGRERQPRPLSASLATPRRRARGTQPSEWLPARRPRSPGARARRRRGAGFLRERPSTADSPAACSTFSATQTQPLPGAWKLRLRGLRALSTAGRGTCSRGRHRRHGPICACAASGAWSRGAPHAAITAGNASPRGRRCSLESGRAGGGSPRSCPLHYRSDSWRPCFCSLFFFFSPSFRPFPQSSTFLFPLPLPFLLRGRVEKDVGEGWGREVRGGAELEPRPRGGPSPRGHWSPPPTSRGDPRGARGPSAIRLEPLLLLRSAGPQPKPSWEEKALSGALHSFLRGSDSLCGVGLLPWPQAGGGCSSRLYQRRGKWRWVSQSHWGECRAGCTTLEEKFRSHGGSWNFHAWLAGWGGALKLERDPPTGASRSPFPAAAPQESPWPCSVSLPRPGCRDGDSECRNRLLISPLLLPKCGLLVCPDACKVLSPSCKFCKTFLTNVWKLLEWGRITASYSVRNK